MLQLQLRWESSGLSRTLTVRYKQANETEPLQAARCHWTALFIVGIVAVYLEKRKLSFNQNIGEVS